MYGEEENNSNDNDEKAKVMLALSYIFYLGPCSAPALHSTNVGMRAAKVIKSEQDYFWRVKLKLLFSMVFW